MHGDVRNEYEQQMNDDIIQIMPAPGWRIAYLMDEGDIWVKPLLCWAVVDDSDTIGRNITAVTVEETMVDFEDPPCDNALGYLAPGERVPKHWKRQAKAQRKKYRRNRPTAIRRLGQVLRKGAAAIRHGLPTG